MMPDRDPTPGELRIMFSNILDALKDVKETMATKEFVNAKFDGYNDRVKRIEDDQKEWTQVSTAAHVELDKDSKARHAETQSKLEAVELRLATQMEKDRLKTANRFKEQEDRSYAIEQNQKQARSIRVMTIAGWAVTGVVAVVAPIIVTVVMNGAPQ